MRKPRELDVAKQQRNEHIFDRLQSFIDNSKDFKPNGLFAEDGVEYDLFADEPDPTEHDFLDSLRDESVDTRKSVETDLRYILKRGNITLDGAVKELSTRYPKDVKLVLELLAEVVGNGTLIVGSSLELYENGSQP